MRKLEPLISVIIPVYNVEKFIERCLKSILKQDYQNIEIIAVDDGSTDNSGKVCDMIASEDNRVKVLHISNGGAGQARNIGIEQANGDFIMFMDSDDYLLEGCLTRMLLLAIEKELDMVQCSYVKGYEESCEKKIEIGEELILTTNEAFRTRKINICVWAKLCKKEIVKDLRYPPKSLFDDEFFTYKMIYAAKRIGFIDEPYYYYYQSDNSIMRSQKKELPLGYIEAYRERIRFFEERGEEELVGISHKELAIRLMLSYLNGKKYSDFANKKREIADLFKNAYNYGFKYMNSLKEKISLTVFYIIWIIFLKRNK